MTTTEEHLDLLVSIGSELGRAQCLWNLAERTRQHARRGETAGPQRDVRRARARVKVVERALALQKQRTLAFLALAPQWRGMGPR